MNVNLTKEQRDRVELISIYTGKSPTQVLVDAAQFLFNCDANYFPPFRPAPTQRFLPEDELEARFSRLLRH
ncbi:MAG TPA: hypothetical protein VGN01_04175 [Acidobacteriaceae bacterium]